MPTKKLVLVPNTKGSESIKRLAINLSNKLQYRVFRIRQERIRNRNAFILPTAIDKLTQLKYFKQAGIAHVEFTFDREIANTWIDEGIDVVCRTLLRASEGRGISIADSTEKLIPAPLYTKYFKKKKEFRVHVLNGNVIDVQEKRKRRGIDERDARIRNTANGYVFCRDGLVEPTGLRDIAIRATECLGYSLGAVDIGWNEYLGRLVIFEVNTCPGLEGTTLENYANAILEWHKETTNAL